MPESDPQTFDPRAFGTGAEGLPPEEIARLYAKASAEAVTDDVEGFALADRVDIIAQKAGGAAFRGAQPGGDLDLPVLGTSPQASMHESIHDEPPLTSESLKKLGDSKHSLVASN